jgi:hypothetical protein
MTRHPVCAPPGIVTDGRCEAGLPSGGHVLAHRTGWRGAIREVNAGRKAAVEHMWLHPCGACITRFHKHASNGKALVVPLGYSPCRANLNKAEFSGTQMPNASGYEREIPRPAIVCMSADAHNSRLSRRQCPGSRESQGVHSLNPPPASPLRDNQGSQARTDVRPHPRPIAFPLDCSHRSIDLHIHLHPSPGGSCILGLPSVLMAHGVSFALHPPNRAARQPPASSPSAKPLQVCQLPRSLTFSHCRVAQGDENPPLPRGPTPPS